MNPSEALPHTLIEVLSEAELRCLIEDLGGERMVAAASISVR